ncbi:phytanoyl-CoA dioxygenase family protein [Akkermansiaceae bacterium]|nr:phytanoyl-CoA dioxygenase family protein [Akkermansiaceae bacterium]
MKISYKIDTEDVEIDAVSDVPPSLGEDLTLASEFHDITRDQEWYEEGYSVLPMFNKEEFASMKQGLSKMLQQKLQDCGVDTEGFELEKYHYYVDDDIHAKVVAMTRELYPDDFGFSTEQVREKLSATIGKKIGYYNPVKKQNQWIIVRINRPGSTDFNPVHKDIYGLYETYNKVPKMVNFWIPICGIGGRTGLPVVPGSHLLSEKQILRFPSGCTVNGKLYRVNNIIEWNGSSELITIVPDEGSLLMFSSHLIHGLGRNLNPDTTRVSFEFRLYAEE